jgi:hypothetical protein
MANTNLRDSDILRDFTVWIKGNGKMGTCPSFQLPEIKIQTEDFRGGGMDMAVEIPMGVEKIEFDFDMHVWDPEIFQNLGYDVGAMDVPLMFRGYMLSPNGAQKSVMIATQSLIKAIKPGKVEPGKKTEISVSVSANRYVHKIDTKIVNSFDAFNKVMIINGQDKSSEARRILGFDY